MIPSAFRTLPLVRRSALAAAALLVAGQAFAGVYYKQETTSNPDTAGSMTAEVWVEGEKGRIEFTSSTNPMAPAGSYLVTEDGGRTMILVNPEEETWSEWDLEALAQTAGSLLNSLGGIVKFDFDDLETRVLEEGPGEEILGRKTRFFKQETSYTMLVKVIGLKQRQETETVTEMWLTDADPSHQVGLWLKNDPPKTGNEDLDQMIAASMDFPEGIPLRTRTTTVMRQVNRKGKVKNKQTSVSDNRVIAWENVDTSNIDFGVPSGFNEVPFMVPGADAEGGNPLKGLLNRDGR